MLVEDSQVIGRVALGDERKEAGLDLRTERKTFGIRPIMATGDNEAVAKSVAEELNIEYRANQSPQDKFNLPDALKREGQTVIMVGDGVNDAPSLDPADIKPFLELAHKTSRKMTENLLWGAAGQLSGNPCGSRYHSSPWHYPDTGSWSNSHVPVHGHRIHQCHESDSE